MIDLKYLRNIKENTEISHPENLDKKDDIQVKIALRNLGVIDSKNIDEYIARDGYFALYKVLKEMSQQEVIDIIKDSKLRGRGGAGFPTGRKWQTAFDYDVDKKYIICNADEGDPGAYMDRSILEYDPHSVIEAMIIAGYAIGSDEGFIYVRAEYPKAVKSLNYAIKEASEKGFLGENIMDSGFNFTIELRLGSGAFVCGESTALMESIEGKRGMPRVKIHRTAFKGLWQKPTVINNVETLANVCQIILNGSDWYRSIGTEKSPGTKVFSLVGDVKKSGLIEVSMGTSLREIIYDLGGGIENDKKLKAVQTGGPSGGCIPAKFLDKSVDYETLKELDSIMGSGGMVVMDEDTCMVDIARFFLEFTCDESCGKCVPCREGTKRILEILERIVNGDGRSEDIDKLMELCELTTETSLCGLGKSAAFPVISTLKYFKNEYIDHIKNKHCTAGTCKNLIHFSIKNNCVGCGTCKRNCPVSCISGSKKEIHKIDQEKCIKCGTCLDVCPIKPKAVAKG
ncbi:4Fe-4S dicluster domain-containing protein [Anaerococcus sp. WCA-380-WT-2B]|uniref:4Fe-4S dicluster domain-containing protein n=1 Tax=Anaerococcus porci TaxID=2652269 RepID=A0A6N7VFS7_9FIRM|nr:NADH-ubiquinone oxidoreductase-F iron-sulfur binding region domain-containing protein [Anaerococcus porci]MSS78300.1 4Fe-4S dicluster domain-containing protein [Anaerococcus porci]